MAISPFCITILGRRPEGALSVFELGRLKQQSAIQEKLTELAKRETEVYRTAFEKEKELTDRAFQVAEIGKPKSNWELQGLLGLAAFVLGLYFKPPITGTMNLNDRSLSLCPELFYKKAKDLHFDRS